MYRITTSIKDVSSVAELIEWMNSLSVLKTRWQRDWLIKRVKKGKITVMWTERGGFNILNKGL